MQKKRVHVCEWKTFWLPMDLDSCSISQAYSTGPCRSVRAKKAKVKTLDIVVASLFFFLEWEKSTVQSSVQRSPTIGSKLCRARNTYARLSTNSCCHALSASRIIRFSRTQGRFSRAASNASFVQWNWVATRREAFESQDRLILLKRMFTVFYSSAENSDFFRKF